jgi:hypothetical protein
MREIFDEIIAEYRDYPKDPGHDQRVAFEAFRRDPSPRPAASRASDF